jgi:hypothetical protein
MFIFLEKAIASKLKKANSKSITSVPVESVEFAIEQIKEFIDFRLHNDLDRKNDNVVSDEKWNKFYEWFYSACQ